MIPTDKQQQWLWEQCGYTGKLKSIEDIGEREGKLVYVTPPIDLNNLFKYAVPKVKFLRIERQHYPLSGDWLVTIQMYKYEIEIDDNDLTTALFWAIYKALGGKDER